MNNKIQLSPYLYDMVKKRVNLADFLSSRIGCNLKWYEKDISAGTSCPMPNHRETKPSFRIKFMEESGVWIYHCLGCGVKGTIIDFCMDYYNLDSSAESVLFICEKLGFKESDVSAMDSIGDIKKRVDLQKKIHCAHIVASRQCFYLLKKNYNEYNKWVADAYRKMNKALDNDDLDTIESVGFEVSNKI